MVGMTNADGEVPPAAQPSPPPIGHQAYPPSGYPPTAYPLLGYGPTQGYSPQLPPPYPPPPPPYPPPPPWYPPPPPPYPPPSAYPPPGYGSPPLQPALQPGVIPLRPLTLSDIFNGAVAYIRANPKATLGLTTIVVLATQIIALIFQVAPLAATGELRSLRGEQGSNAALLGSSVAGIASLVATGLSAILLSGMLTVVIGRAVFGAHITIGEAWEKVRGRLVTLIGLTALEAAGAAVLIGAVVFVIVAVANAAGGGAAWVVGIPLGIALIVALAYLGTILSFAPVAIVLERLPVFRAITRSFTLVRGSFWRVFGIRLLAAVVAGLIANAVAIPFTVAGQVLTIGVSSTGPVLVAVVLRAVGSAIGQIITAPFSAGVVVLLYTDRRIRAHAFDLVLQTGAVVAPAGPVGSTDDLWLIQHP
ncbi:MAG: hypothetical protein JO044_04035 [Mycobacteriaceae bacterium]|nr:hypothetical protein [Mycobacteriaceae bacterium]